jgi:hypothetical protein
MPAAMGKQQSSAVPSKMIVGMNYPHPWNAYGVYLGGGNPPGSFAALDQWTNNLFTNLIFMRDNLNLRVVRIFLLGNAANYGTVVPGAGPPSRFGALPAFVPPATLHPKFGQHLTAMFQAFQSAKMLVIPSMIDFKAFGSTRTFPSKVKGRPGPTNGCTGKDDIVRVAATRKIFFDQVFDPFLRISIPFRDVIFAWEVQNEPIWNIFGIVGTAADPSVAGVPTISEDESKAFLKEGVRRIETAFTRLGTFSDNLQIDEQFQSTVGHRFADDLTGALPTGSKRQFHYYPRAIGSNSSIGPLPANGLLSPRIVIVDRSLPPFSETNAFVGEIAVEDPSEGHGDLWNELGGSDNTTDTSRRVLVRLQHVQAKGYPMVLLWPDGLDGPIKQPVAPGPDPIKLSSLTQKGIQDFMKSQ